jgi:hypothetical protein
MSSSSPRGTYVEASLSKDRFAVDVIDRFPEAPPRYEVGPGMTTEEPDTHFSVVPFSTAKTDRFRYDNVRPSTPATGEQFSSTTERRNAATVKFEVHAEKNVRLYSWKTPELEFES